MNVSDLSENRSVFTNLNHFKRSKIRMKVFAGNPGHNTLAIYQLFATSKKAFSI